MTSTTDSEPRRARPHLVWWDRLRIAAAFDVTYFHMQLTHGLFGIGLPTFLLLATGLPSRRVRETPLGDYARHRAGRTLRPWIFYFFLYGALRALGEWAHGQPPFGWWVPTMVLYGPQENLWFLPFIFLLGLAANRVHALTLRFDTLKLAAGLSALGLGTCLLQLLPAHPTPFHQWRFALPALPFGLALGAFDRARAEGRRHGATVLCLALLGALLVLALLFPDTGLAELAIRYAMAMGLVILGEAFPGEKDRVTAGLSDVAFGIVMIAPLVHLYVVRRVFDRLGLEGAVQATLAACLSFLATGALAYALRRTPLRAVL